METVLKPDWIAFSRRTGARLLARLLPCALALTVADAAAAGPALPAISAGARLAANCAACHGTNGITEGIALPSLAGQGKGALLVALKAFKSGARQGTIMPQIAKGYTDEQLALLAEFFAAQPPVPTAAMPPRQAAPVAQMAARDHAAARARAMAAQDANEANEPEEADTEQAASVSRIAVTGWRQPRPIGAAPSAQRFAATWIGTRP